MNKFYLILLVIVLVSMGAAAWLFFTVPAAAPILAEEPPVNCAEWSQEMQYYCYDLYFEETVTDYLEPLEQNSTPAVINYCKSKGPALEDICYYKMSDISAWENALNSTDIDYLHLCDIISNDTIRDDCYLEAVQWEDDFLTIGAICNNVTGSVAREDCFFELNPSFDI